MNNDSKLSKKLSKWNINELVKELQAIEHINSNLSYYMNINIQDMQTRCKAVIQALKDKQFDFELYFKYKTTSFHERVTL